MSPGKHSPPRRPTPRWAVVLLLVVAFVMVNVGIQLDRPAVADGPSPLGIDCHDVGGVRFCQGNPDWTGGGRTDSFDGFPLDVDVTMPPTGNGPWPTLVMLHPWTTSKTLFEATKPRGGHSVMMGQQWNNNFFARRGYLVVNFTSRWDRRFVRRDPRRHRRGERAGHLVLPGRRLPALRRQPVRDP